MKGDMVQISLLFLGVSVQVQVLTEISHNNSKNFFYTLKAYAVDPHLVWVSGK